MKRKHSVLVSMSIVALFLFVSANVVSAAVKVTSAAPESITLKPGETIKIGLQGNDLRSVKSAYVAMRRSVVVEGKRKIRETRIKWVKAIPKYIPPKGTTKGRLDIKLTTDPKAQFALKGNYTLRLILIAGKGKAKSKHRVAALKIQAGPVQYKSTKLPPSKELRPIPTTDNFAIPSRRVPDQVTQTLNKTQRTVSAPDLPIEQTPLEIIPAQGPAVVAQQGNYIALDDRTVIDTKNKLMWFSTESRTCYLRETFRMWHDHVGSLSRGGYTDWRLPTLAEVKTLYYDRPQESVGKYTPCSKEYTVKLTNLIRISCTHVVWGSLFTEQPRDWGFDMTIGKTFSHTGWARSNGYPESKIEEDGGNAGCIKQISNGWGCLHDRSVILPVRTWNPPRN